MSYKDKEKYNAYHREYNKKYYLKHRIRLREREKAYRKKNRDKIREWSKVWEKAHYKERRNQRIKRVYGIDETIYDNLFKVQAGVCAICKQAEHRKHRAGKVVKLAIDHCHKTKKVRGLLCSRCNNGIGAFEDDINLFTMAIEYLKNNQDE